MKFIRTAGIVTTIREKKTNKKQLSPTPKMDMKNNVVIDYTCINKVLKNHLEKMLKEAGPQSKRVGLSPKKLVLKRLDHFLNIIIKEEGGVKWH